MKSRPEALAPTRVPFGFKVIASLLVLGHFSAILMIVLAMPVDSLMSRGINYVYPYLRFVMLTNAYRFYAPDPGPTGMAWFRIQYKDKSVRWFDIPNHEDSFLRMPYQRRLCVAMFMEGNVQPDPNNPMQRVLTPAGRTTLSSYARFVAGQYTQNEENSVEEVQIYGVSHRVPFPEEIKRGFHSLDMRLYQALYLGAYTAEGVSKAPQASEALRTAFGLMDGHFLAARILQEDIYPLLEKNPQTAPWELLSTLHLPAPVKDLLQRFPELLDPTGPRLNLVERILDLLRSQDRTVINS